MSCSDGDENSPAVKVDPDNIFFNYKITGEEGRDEITVHIRFHRRSPSGRTLALPAPARVELDGEQLPLDSAEYTGAYYEMQKNLDSFRGKHIISFTDHRNKVYKEEFEFTPFTLENMVPEVLNRGDLEFSFSGLAPADHLRVLMIDTAFSTNDINELMAVKNGRLVVTQDLLKAITNGPIYLEFYRETEIPLKNTTRKGGVLTIVYGLKRQFELQGTP